MSFLFIVFLQFGKQSVGADVSGRSPNPMHRAMSQLDLLPADAWRRIVRFICVPVGIDAEPLTAELYPGISSSEAQLGTRANHLLCLPWSSATRMARSVVA